MMKKQWTCSRCGSQFSATWQPGLKISIPVVCNTCNKRKETMNAGIVMNSNLLNRLSPDVGRPRNVFFGSSSNSPQIGPSSSQNVPFSVGDIGMIFGNLTFAPTLAIPLTIRGKPQEVKKVKTEVVTADDYHLRSRERSALKDYHTAVQIIKREFESYEEEIVRNKKKRKNPPQETVSPLKRFINQLRQFPPCLHRPVRRAKYDDELIYERSSLSIAENEIGLGAQKLAPPSEVSGKIKTPAPALWWQMAMKEEK